MIFHIFFIISKGSVTQKLRMSGSKFSTYALPHTVFIGSAGNYDLIFRGKIPLGDLL